jgi:hypothetical protein
MQGTWCITIKSKNSMYSQQLEISGANSGNGIYDMSLNMPPVLASGNNWTISIKTDFGNGFRNLDEQIRFPYKEENKYRFDIDATTADAHNFYNTVLSCYTPQTICDFIIYGNVSTYDEPCFFNPYNHFSIVIETREAFFEALKYDALRFAIKKLYLDRLSKEILMSPLERISESFTPIIIPVHNETVIPPSLGQVLKIMRKPNKKSDETDSENYSITTQEIFALIQSEKLKAELNRQALSHLFEHVLPRSITEPLGEIELQFYEYIRTSAEFCGGLFSGEGKRKKLGSSISDPSGNYIFHFYKSRNAYIDSTTFKSKLSKNTAFQFMPDILIQVRKKETNELIHETVPYWNNPLFKRINICLPKKKLALLNKYMYAEDNPDISESDAELVLV